MRDPEARHRACCSKGRTTGVTPVRCHSGGKQRPPAPPQALPQPDTGKQVQRVFAREPVVCLSRSPRPSCLADRNSSKSSSLRPTQDDETHGVPALSESDVRKELLLWPKLDDTPVFCGGSACRQHHSC